MLKYVTPRSWVERPMEILFLGVGGTGSRLLTHLADMAESLHELGHPGFHVMVMDPDRVEPANLGRQAFFWPDLGRNKAEILVHRLVSSRRHLSNWIAVPEAWTPDVRLGRANLIITCVDQAKVRMHLAQQVESWRKIMWLDTGNSFNTGQVVFGDLGSGTDGRLRLPNVVDLFREALEQTDDEDEPSCSFEEAVGRQDPPINTGVAQVAYEILWCLFRHGGLLDTHGACLDLRRPGSVTPIPIDPKVWALMGYEPRKEAA